MTFVPAMIEPGKVDELSSAAEPSVSGQIIVEASGLLIRIPPDVSADHIERPPEGTGRDAARGLQERNGGPCLAGRARAQAPSLLRHAVYLPGSERCERPT